MIITTTPTIDGKRITSYLGTLLILIVGLLSGCGSGGSGDSGFVPETADAEKLLPTDGNTAPVLNPIGDRSVKAGETLQFTVAATDDTPPLLEANALPPGGDYFDYVDGTATFTWKTTFGDIGEHTVTFTAIDASDPTLVDSETVTLSVIDDSTDGNGGPVFPGSTWAIATPASQGVDSLLLADAIDYLDSLPAVDRSAELVVVRNGYVIFQGTNADNRHGVWSVTKSFVSLLFGLLVDDRKLSLETLAADIDADLWALYPTLRMKHLLNMTSGYRAKDDDSKGDYVHGPSLTPFDPVDPLFTPPGSKHAYWDSAANQLGYLVTIRAGKSMKTFFQERIGAFIGLDPDAWDWGDFGQVDGVTINGGAGNHGNHVIISAIELARFGHLILNRGYWDGTQLISPNWIDAVTDVQVPVDIPWAVNGTDRLDGRGVYGYLWWRNGIQPDGNPMWPGGTPGTFAARGFNNNKLFVVPEWNMVIVRLGLDAGGGTTIIKDAEWGRFLSLVGQAVN